MKHSSCVEVDLNEFAKTRRVVILECFGVTKSLKERVRVQHLLFDCRVFFRALRLLSFRLSRLLIQKIFSWSVETFTSSGQISQDNFGGLSLASSRLARDNDRLVRSVNHKVLKAILSYH